MPVTPDQIVCRAVMIENGLHRALHFRDNALRQDFSQLYAPLVERIEIPDDALRENVMFVKRNKLPQGRGRKPSSEDHVRWPVALKHPVRDQPFGCALRSYFLRRFTERQCRRLREHIGQEYVVVRAELIQRKCERDEIARDQSRPLVYQLIKRVLPICAGLAPVDRTGLIIHDPAVKCRSLTVTLHRQLLQIRGKSLEVLFVRQHRDRVSPEEIDVPNT